MIQLYFAYGSDMKIECLRRQARAVRALGIGRLDGRRLLVKKRSTNGSAKANLVAARGARVWGVLYEIGVRDWPRLDRRERGYVRTRVRVTTPTGYECAATTYVSGHALDAVPLAGYRALLIEGAREHGLPEDYVAQLQALPCRSGHAAGE